MIFYFIAFICPFVLYNKQTDRQTKTGANILVFAFGRYFLFSFVRWGQRENVTQENKQATTKEHVLHLF